jgi:hypothetical protein
VPFDAEFKENFPVGEKVCIGLVKSSKTWKWSGEAKVAALTFPLRLFKHANPESEVKQSHILVTNVKLAQSNVQPPQNARKFLKGSLVNTEGKLTNTTPDTLKSILDRAETSCFYVDIKCVMPLKQVQAENNSWD